MTEQEERVAVIKEAKTWLKTPFHHEGRLKHVGVDCGQLEAMVFPAVMPRLGEIRPPFYRFQHHLNSQSEDYIAQLEKYATEIPESKAQPGDIVIYKFGRTFSHAGIIVDPWPGLIINAVSGFGVIYTHGTTDGFIAGRPRRFFNPWLGPTKQS